MYIPSVYTKEGGKIMTPNELKKWRKKTGYSQSQIARVLGVATMTISRWERGTREIPSFLHLTLECIEKKDGEKRMAEGKKTELTDAEIKNRLVRQLRAKGLKDFKKEMVTEDMIEAEREIIYATVLTRSIGKRIKEEKEKKTGRKVKK
jgi:transcriptional regulator with XRE-family HTH domain